MTEKELGDEKMLYSMASLQRSCERVHGALPSLQMTLRDFILSYGRNGIIFAVIREVGKE